MKARVRREGSKPFQLVKYFERALRGKGVPIQFELSLDRECRHARLLLRACKSDFAEAQLLIAEFVEDEWERQHNRSLSRVVALVDELRTRFRERQRKKARAVLPDDILRL